jgi:hypothetical protein
MLQYNEDRRVLQVRDFPFSRTKAELIQILTLNMFRQNRFDIFPRHSKSPLPSLHVAT